MQKININAFMSHVLCTVMFRAHDDCVKIQAVHGERIQKSFVLNTDISEDAWVTVYKIQFRDRSLGENSEYSIHFTEINDSGDQSFEYTEYVNTVKVKNIVPVDRYGHCEVLRAADGTTTVDPEPDVEYSLLNEWTMYADEDMYKLLDEAFIRYVDLYLDEQYARDQAHEREALGLNMSPDSEPVPA